MRTLIKTNSLLILNALNYFNHKALLRRMYIHTHKQCIKEVDSRGTKLNSLIKKYWEQTKKAQKCNCMQMLYSVRSLKMDMLKVSKKETVSPF